MSSAKCKACGTAPCSCASLFNTKKKKEYIGGAANDSHIHVHGGGFHLKLGNERYDIVNDKNGKLKKDQYDSAMLALRAITGDRAAWAAKMITAIDELLP
jgi:hypothetical protein